MQSEDVYRVHQPSTSAVVDPTAFRPNRRRISSSGRKPTSRVSQFEMRYRWRGQAKHRRAEDGVVGLVVESSSNCSARMSQRARAGDLRHHGRPGISLESIVSHSRGRHGISMESAARELPSRFDFLSDEICRRGASPSVGGVTLGGIRLYVASDSLGPC